MKILMIIIQLYFVNSLMRIRYKGQDDDKKDDNNKANDILGNKRNRIDTNIEEEKNDNQRTTVQSKEDSNIHLTEEQLGFLMGEIEKNDLKLDFRLLNSRKKNPLFRNSNSVKVLLDENLDWNVQYSNANMVILPLDQEIYECNKDCTTIFYSNIHQLNKGHPNSSNSGYFAFKDHINDIITFFKYYRLRNANPYSHTELEILDLFSNLPSKEGTIYISSWFCPCLTCLNKLLCFSKKFKKINIELYCWSKYKIEIFKSAVGLLEKYQDNYFKDKNLKTVPQIQTRYNDIVYKNLKVEGLMIHYLSEN